MSAQEFKVGQQVKDGDYERLPVGSKATDGAGTIVKAAPRGWRYDRPGEVTYPNSDWSDERTLTHLGDGTHAEPEDKDDLYVEPEPLKEGDWCLVWAEVQGSEWSDDTTPVHLPVPDPDLIFVPRDAIVRPDAGQVPPWVKPSDCPSLHETAPRLLRRCQRVAGHEGQHVSFGDFWYDSGEAGRITEAGAS